MKALEVIIMMLAGGAAGWSSGIGLFPIYPQPKNIRIQLLFTIVAVLLFVLWFLIKH